MRIKIKNQKSNLKIILLIIAFLVFPLFANAVLIENNNTEVINEIRVEASTGNNNPPAGGEGGEDEQVIEGEEKLSVEIKTIINGQELESIHLESESESIEVKSEVKVGQDGEVIVNREVSEIPEASIIEIKGAEPEEPISFRQWWSGFVENLKSIFLGIFKIFG
jgi:hypothetical protein